MLYHAAGGSVHIADTDMDYIRFGQGETTLVMLPGLGDGLKTVKGTALPFALLYRKLAKACTVYVFSRRNRLPEGFSTRDMAGDVYAAMERLGLASACVLGVSQGGMIAQHLAVDHPECVDRLLLAFTLARPNETANATIRVWIDMAKAGDYKRLMIDTAERSYSEAYLKKARRSYALLGSFGKPKSFARFLTQADACLTHDAYDALDGIRCPTLVIGGADDRIVTARASEEIAQRIPGSTLYLYPGLGHGAYEEAPDFVDRVLAFCTQA